VLLYLATEAWTERFRTFLRGYAAVLRVATAWTLCLVFPCPLDHFYSACQTVIREELESPLHPATISELLWYFEHRRQANVGPVHPQTQGFLKAGAKARSRFGGIVEPNRIGNRVVEWSPERVAQAIPHGWTGNSGVT
jgi:hypothetical protein